MLTSSLLGGGAFLGVGGQGAALGLNFLSWTRGSLRMQWWKWVPTVELVWSRWMWMTFLALLALDDWMVLVMSVTLPGVDAWVVPVTLLNVLCLGA